jgi:hypothetical protein
VGSQAGFVVFYKAITFNKTQNNKERQVVSHQPLSAAAWVHFHVSVHGVYGG